LDRLRFALPVPAALEFGVSLSQRRLGRGGNAGSDNDCDDEVTHRRLLSKRSTDGERSEAIEIMWNHCNETMTITKHGTTFGAAERWTARGDS
jgi:hypothetical protein